MRRHELPSLTGIRFYAALAVFLSHIRLVPGMSAFTSTSRLFNAGDIGVSFFFVLSGFILTYNYVDVFHDGVSAADYVRFIWDRLSKIYPVHVLVTVMVLPISILSPHLVLDWSAVPVHLGLLQCFWPSSTPAFYEQLNVPSWSISCEWFFYLLAPATIFLAFGARRRWVPIAGTATYLGGLAVVLWHGDESARQYFLGFFAPSRFGEFVVGVFLAGLFLRWPTDRLARFSSRSQAIGIVLIVAADVVRHEAPWPLPVGLLYAPGSALLIIGLVHGRGRFAAHLSRPTLNRLGMASFALYLIHEPLIRAVKGVCLHLGWSVQSWPGFFGVTLAMFLVIQAAALIICFLYELPLQRRLRRAFVVRRQFGAAAFHS